MWIKTLATEVLCYPFVFNGNNSKELKANELCSHTDLDLNPSIASYFPGCLRAQHLNPLSLRLPLCKIITTSARLRFRSNFLDRVWLDYAKFPK